jgi:lipooligosaccharide transport system ATP-binding protein
MSAGVIGRMVAAAGFTVDDRNGRVPVGVGPVPSIGVPNAVITARDLRKEFGDFVAVDGIDFDVAPGESFGFLGPNGAGKTSTMRMIGCVSPITTGTLRIFGLDPELDSELTVVENLIIYGRYFDIPRSECRRRAADLLEFVQLTERANERVDPLSGGMKRRLTIARSLMSEPDLLLLDEPTTGLDPQARHILWDRLYRLKQRGVTLVLTTHYMDEAEQLCDRLVVMDGGRIVAEGSPRGLIEQHATREVLELRLHRDTVGDVAGQSDRDNAALATIEGIGDRQEVLPDRVLIYAHDGEAALAEVHRRGVEPVGSLVRRSSLEDVFLRLTGRTLVD